MNTINTFSEIIQLLFFTIIEVFYVSSKYLDLKFNYYIVHIKQITWMI